MEVKKGFTLAEVLITLAIIGIVAALTIPVVVRNYQKQQTVTQLKKVYSALSNTTNLAIAEHGPMEGWEVGNWGSDAFITFTNTYLIPYLKVSKKCGVEMDGDCKFEYKALNSPTIRTLDYGSRFYLTDGTFILTVPADYGVCSGSGGNTVCYGGTSAEIYIDLNGRKPPNTYGKDIFKFIYYIDTPDVPGITNLYSSKFNGKFMPEGFALTRNELTAKTGNYNLVCNKNKTGYYCAALIMRDSWQIRDDYPWN